MPTPSPLQITPDPPGLDPGRGESPWKLFHIQHIQFLFGIHFLMENKIWLRTNVFTTCKVKWNHSVVSDSLWPHRRQLTRLPHPWDSPGKNTGVVPGSSPSGSRVIRRGEGVGVLGKNLFNYSYIERLETDSVVGKLVAKRRLNNLVYVEYQSPPT